MTTKKRVLAIVPVCGECGKQHLTFSEHPSCPGHIKNGTRQRKQVKAIGEPCAHERGWSTVHPGYGLCKLHGGNMPVHVRSAQLQAAQVECDVLGIPAPIDPGDALMQLVHEWNGNKAFYRGILEGLPKFQADDEFVEGSPETGAGGYYKRADPGIVGRTYHVSGMPTGEAKRSIYVALYEDACDRLATYCEKALKAGIAERQIRIDEAEARSYFTKIIRGIEAVDLAPDVIELIRQSIAKQFREVIPDERGLESGESA